MLGAERKGSAPPPLLVQPPVADGTADLDGRTWGSKTPVVPAAAVSSPPRRLRRESRRISRFSYAASTPNLMSATLDGPFTASFDIGGQQAIDAIAPRLSTDFDTRVRDPLPGGTSMGRARMQAKAYALSGMGD